MYAGQEATEPDMEQRTGSKLGTEYLKAVYCHPAYLTYITNGGIHGNGDSGEKEEEEEDHIRGGDGSESWP